MILISITTEIKNGIKQLLRRECSKVKSNIFTKDDVEYSEKFKKEKIVITENNKVIIDYFISKNKTVIIYDQIENSEYQDYKNVHICKTETELIDIVKSTIKRNKQKTIKKAVKLVSVLLVFTISMFTTYATYKNYLYKQEQKQIELQKENLKKENIVFVGDSITDFYDLNKHYKGLPVVNSGISGNKTYDILDNIKKRIYDYNPTKVFLMIGTNDLSHQTDEQIVKNITDIINGISENRPNAEIYVESIYPVNPTTDNAIVKDWMVGKRDNERIKKINKLIKQTCQDNGCNYINMYNILTDENGNLKLEYTVDGLHISEYGYQIITKKIMDYINL